ncbi:alpha-ketoglutarate-dependent dioxygenase FTO isoform X2 [Clupea harengus]|uniref:Alpha-ketoglutarate-dependent dioxygenase FTO n=1 Tax=Clupea harengus TaxID=7950 RepID=A0A6P3VVZ9_CLUHA|nr:alpha-ketoglutarate-dependent dioxygenase FTO isoform X2 [Clupea harengus]
MTVRGRREESETYRVRGTVEPAPIDMRRRLLQELGDQRIPFLSPSDPGFQQLWESSYSGLALRPSVALPNGLHERVQQALCTLRGRGCLLRDLVRVRDRDVFTIVSRALLGQPGHTYRYLDTRLFAIPWHSDDQAETDDNGNKTKKKATTETCCDPDLRAAFRALWELNRFFCQDVQKEQEARGHRQDCRKSQGNETRDQDKETADQGEGSSEGMCGKSEGEKEESDGEEEEEDDDEEEEEEEEEEMKTKEDEVMKEEGDLDTGQGCSHTITAAASPPCSPRKVGPVPFNITLLNYMDPFAMSQLKQEPYYGMGKMAVGWHHDENLVPLSPVAVYSYSCLSEKVQESEPAEAGDAGKDTQSGGSGESGSAEAPGSSSETGDAGDSGDPSDPGEGESGTAAKTLVSQAGDSGEKQASWRVGLKVAWDIHTPGLALPLQSGDCYYMTDDLNRTHQHCVLAGDSARFSSTHRVAQCSTGTLDYIQRRCAEALHNLKIDPDTGAKSLSSLLPTTLEHCEEIHNEVEFEWLRQYWFQGRRYARFCSWWSQPMEQLEKDWIQMEVMTHLLLGVVEDESTAQEDRREMADTLLNALTDRQQHRQTWRDRCQSSLAQTLPPEEAPLDRPYWDPDDPEMPLPFDLADIISRVESLLWRM